MPSGRSDCGKPRKLDDDLRERIAYLKGRYPRMSAAAIFRQLKEDGSIKNGEVSESTVNRYVNSLALEAEALPMQDMRRYERPHINEVWCGDSSVGPYLKTPDGRKRRVHIAASNGRFCGAKRPQCEADRPQAVAFVSRILS